jgi:tetratricopeptide (TPR) repeat protein
MKHLNLRLLVWLITVPAVLGIGIHFLHAYQIERNAGSLRARAEEAQKAGKTEEAISQYLQYLKHRDDANAYGEVAKLVADAAEKTDATQKDVYRAIQVLEAAVRRHTELTDIRRRLADLYLKYGRFRDAMDHLDRMRTDGKVLDVELEVKYAQCLLAIRHDEKARKILSTLIGFDPIRQEFLKEPARGTHSIDAYLLLAEVFRKNSEDSTEAVIVINQMVAANPDTGQAYLERGRFLQRQKKLAEADKDLAKALELAPNDAATIIAAAEVATLQNDYPRAEKLLLDGMQKFPADERIYRGLASLSQAQKKPEDAMKYVELGLKQQSKSPYLLLLRADLELQTGDLDSVRSTVKAMREENFVPELVDYIDCCILVAEQEWLKAARTMEKLRPLMARFPDLTMKLDLMMGQCYQNQGQPDRALDAYRRVLDADPSSLPARLGYAQAMSAVGKTKQAQSEFAKLQDLMSSSSGGTSVPMLNNVLQMKIADEIRKPKAERNWKVVDKIASEILKDGSLNDAQKAVMNADLLLIKDEVKQARSVLSAAVKQHPKELAVWLGLIKLVEQDKDSKYTPEDIVTRAEKAVGDVATLKQVRLNIAMRKPAPEAKAAVAKAEQGLDKFSDRERIALLNDFGNAYYRLRDYDNTRRCWLEVAKTRPDDSKIQVTLFQLAEEFGNEADMDATLEEIRKTFLASSATYKFCEAEKLVWLVKQKKAEPKSLAEAKTLLEAAHKLRPDWHELARLSGEINELQNKTDEAISDYQQSLELGPPNPSVARRLIALLYTRGRIDEVEKAMDYMGNLSSTDPLKKIEIEGDLRKGNLDGAMEDAAKVVAAEPDNATNQLWYGQLLARAGRNEEAAQSFRTAVEKDPKLLQGWLMLVEQLAKAKEFVEAQTVIRDSSDKLPEELRDVFLGPAHEMAGDKEQAEKAYQALVSKKPQDLSSARNLAAFYLRANNAEKAQQQLEAMLANPVAADPKASDADKANVLWARRASAQLLASRGDYRGLKDALTMLDANKQDGVSRPEDMMLAASLLAKRPETTSKRQAAELLEKVQAQRGLTPGDQFELARLYEQTGDWAKARDTVVSVIAKVDTNVPLAAAYAQMLIKHDESVEAERWVAKVEAAQPDAPLAIELRARLLYKQGKPEQAGDLLVALYERAPDDKTKLQMAGGIATLLEEFGQLSAAERILRGAVEQAPRAKIMLASFLGRHGDLDETFSLFEESRKSQPLVLVSQLGLEVLRRRSLEAGKQYFAKVDEWINAGLAEDPNALKFSLQRAELHDIQGRNSELISTYRNILSQKNLDSKDRAVVHNNLAFVLALTGRAADAAEGLRLVNEAIEILGPSSDLLDTRAVCYLAQGDTKHAREDLQAAILESPSPVKYMHLAMAESKAGDKTAAQKNLEKARELKLDLGTLSVGERKNYEQLSKELESN